LEAPRNRAPHPGSPGGSCPTPPCTRQRWFPPRRRSERVVTMNRGFPGGRDARRYGGAVHGQRFPNLWTRIETMNRGVRSGASGPHPGLLPGGEGDDAPRVSKRQAGRWLERVETARTSGLWACRDGWRRDSLSLRERVGVREPLSTLARACLGRFMGRPHDSRIAHGDHEPGIPGGETPPSTAGGTPAATEARFMESPLFEIDLLTGHEPGEGGGLRLGVGLEVRREARFMEGHVRYRPAHGP
jgi:hypothetical protein